MSRFLVEIKSKDQYSRVKAAKELREYVEQESREMSSEMFNKFLEDLIQKILHIVNSQDIHEKLGGIMVIDELLDIQCEEQETKIIRFANALRMVFQHGVPSSDNSILETAARALGHLARVGGTLAADFVEFEVKRALEWLQGERFEQRRHAAVLVLKELAENAPTLFNVHVSTFLRHIWVGIRDPIVAIREGAILALRACLSLIAQRDSRWRIQWYVMIYKECQKGFQMNIPEAIHGSLLAVGELFRNSGVDFMQARFKDVFDTILQYCNHKDKTIFITVINLLPHLSNFLPSAFVRGYLKVVMDHLITVLQQNNFAKDSAFLAIGQISLSVKEEIIPQLDTIVALITESLQTKNRRGFAASTQTCISLLARSVGLHLQPYLTTLIDLMFNDGLSATLIDSLWQLYQNIPSLLQAIQERLLSAITAILHPEIELMSDANAKLGFYNAPSLVGNIAIIPSSFNTSLEQKNDPEMITLALKTLGEFYFENCNLLLFVKEVVIKYLDDDNPQIRQQAAVTCSRLLLPPESTSLSEYHQLANHSAIISEILDKLLSVGISDSDPLIRRTILSSFDSRFDPFLAQAENLYKLFNSLNDEVFNIRAESIKIIGRLALKNPANVIPSLRKTLIQLLTELQFSPDTRCREESCRLLGQLIFSAQRLIKPYVASILKVFLPKLNDSDLSVSSQVLSTIGQLSAVGCEDMMENVHNLLPIINQVLRDKSSAVKRKVALRTLSQLVSSTGYVVQPYLNYPDLLPAVLDALRAGESWGVRHEGYKVLGIIGALDPYQYKKSIMNIVGDKNEKQTFRIIMPDIIPSNDDYYPTVAIHALMKVLREPGLSSHHNTVIFAVMYIFRSLGLKCVPFLPQIMPTFLHVMRTCEDSLREQLFQQLRFLVQIVKQHIRNYLEGIFEVIHEFWHDDNLLSSILSLVEEISIALKDESKVFLADLLPLMLQILHNDRSERRQPTIRVLHALEIFGVNLDDHFFLIIPNLVRLFEQIDAPLFVRQLSLQTLALLCRTLNFSDNTSRIIHPLARILDLGPATLYDDIINVICSLIYQLGSDYLIFASMIEKIMNKHSIRYEKYTMLVQKLIKHQTIAIHDLKTIDTPTELTISESNVPDITSHYSSRIVFNQKHLKKAWEVSLRSTTEDWVEWMRRFSVELLNQNPSPALRSCSALAARYHPLAKELFNAAFVCCWTELYDKNQDELVIALETAFQSPSIPPEIIQTLLNLAEFMEHDDKTLPIDIRTLGVLAEKCHAYAKALHYKELEFQSSPTSDVIEALISINNQLQQPAAAVGILEYAQLNYSIELKETWYEKLQRWEEALEAYERKQLEDPTDNNYTLGRMRCLCSLGEWERLSLLSSELWERNNDEPGILAKISPLGATAAWNLGCWDIMEKYVESMDEKQAEGCFFKAILSVHNDQFDKAQEYIESTRYLLDTEMTALIGESYSRAYSVIVSLQQLVELEDIIIFKHSDHEKQQFIRKMWSGRLKGMERNVEVWQRILSVRSLVLSPHEDLKTWLKFSSLCRKNGRLALSLKVLTNLMGIDPLHSDTLPYDKPEVTYAYIKHLWAAGFQQEALKRLTELSDSLADSNDMTLRSRCYLKLGRLKFALTETLNEKSIPEILDFYNLATKFNPYSYKAWNSWSFMNYQSINYYENKDPKMISYFLKPAIIGFFRSISLSGTNASLQNVLRLLTLWFLHGDRQDVENALIDGFNNVSVDTWIDVIPQIIARIHTPQASIRRLIHDLLIKIGKAHPQSLIYPLTVAAKSSSSGRKNAALKILDNMRQNYHILVEQAEMVSKELIRVAILWHEIWHEALEEASKQYFGAKNVEGMIAILTPLHEMLNKGPETLREVSFQQGFGRELNDAYDYCQKFIKFGQESDINQAWELYYHCFRRINKQLTQLTDLELQYVSPYLLQAHDLELAVPGTYRAGQPLVSINGFVPSVKVIDSKQHPRKIGIRGSDGNNYAFLLKGHEDLRQDERVMQLFGLVNNLLAHDSETCNRDLSITRCAVIPLSPNSGLIEWIPHSDTLHALIKEYRDARKILLNIEHRLMLQMAPDYQHLTMMQKVEVFEYALTNTTGQDLYKVLWLKSFNSEQWLDRRTNYTRSLAVMSMLGYILGLGDRHPCNLMLDQYSGKIVHIDFGDCFEVAMKREKYPEKIPFRLTRMLVNAMEVSGIEGNFRETCTQVMRVLRENKESVVAVLEAFVYDPLINWRLLKTGDAPKHNTQSVEKIEIPKGKLPSIPSTSTMKNKDDVISNIGPDGEAAPTDILNRTALDVLERINNKLNGRDFDISEILSVDQQVRQLILEATSHVNLCQCYIGWCPFW